MKRGNRTLAATALAAVAVLGTGGSGLERPADFAVTYNYSNGSLPPPGHYSYRIAVGPSVVLFEWQIGYDGETFRNESRPPAGLLNRLYAEIVKREVLTRRWKPGPTPVAGGQSHSLTLTVDRRNVLVSGLSPADEKEMEPVYAMIQSLVPRRAWELAREKQAAYERGYKR